MAAPELTQRYAEALRSHGGDAAVTIAPGLQHDILLEPVTLDVLKTLVEAAKKDARR